MLKFELLVLSEGLDEEEDGETLAFHTGFHQIKGFVRYVNHFNTYTISSTVHITLPRATENYKMKITL